MLNHTIKQALKQQHRCFSSSKSNNSVLDYFKFFKKKNTDSTPQPKDTKEVIKEVEQNQDEITTNEKIEILGRKNPRYTDKSIILENLNGFQIHRWIPNSNSFVKSLTNENFKTEINSKLNSLFDSNKLSKELVIDDLYLRFNIFKQIQKIFIISIPDSQFTLLDSFKNIELYLISNLDPALKLSKKSEFQPDAVDLDPSAFEGTNVSIGEWTFEKEKQKAYKKLLNKANTLEKISAKQFNQSHQESSSSSSSPSSTV